MPTEEVWGGLLLPGEVEATAPLPTLGVGRSLGICPPVTSWVLPVHYSTSSPPVGPKAGILSGGNIAPRGQNLGFCEEAKKKNKKNNNTSFDV